MTLEMAIHLPRDRGRLQRVATVLTLALCTPSAVATDYYVDAVNGSDANSGATPAEAWRRVSFAFDTLAGAGVGHTIHLAPGVYSQAAGEVYPLPIGRGSRLVGTGGSELTVLEGGWFWGAGSDPYFALELEGVTLIGGQTGIEIFQPHEYDISLHLVDVEILDMAGDGIFVDSYGGLERDTWCDVELERVRIRGCHGDAAAISASAGGGEANVALVARDCEFSGCEEWGLHVLAYSAYFGDGELDLYRCTIAGNRRGGILTPNLTGYNGTWSGLRDCLIVDNAGDGFRADESGFVARCTIANNAGIGIDATHASYALRDTILFGNADDVAVTPGSVTTRYCRITDPDVPPGLGDTRADPLFVDAAAGDYRLRALSRCIDAGDPALAAGVPDLSGRPRPIDGDLDRIERSDIGALEMAPLTWTGAPRIGSSLLLELWGPQGGSARVFFAPAPLAASPAATPFGEFELERGATTHFATTTSAPGPPGALALSIPANPSLIGTTWSFQSLSTSALPGTGQALTNAVSFVILP